MPEMKEDKQKKVFIQTSPQTNETCQLLHIKINIFNETF